MENENKFFQNIKRLLTKLFKNEQTKQIPKTMTLIKNKSDLDYVLMDAILIILHEKGQLNVSQLQYQLLNCGLMVQQPVINEALKELAEHRAIDMPNLN